MELRQNSTLLLATTTECYNQVNNIPKLIIRPNHQVSSPNTRIKNPPQIYNPGPISSLYEVH